MIDMNTQPDRSRREVTVSASPSPTPEHSSALSGATSQRSVRKTTSTQSSGNMRTGRWTLDEKLLFLYGLRKYGKGRWKKISVYLPNRSLVQIKSHAQKVIKRYDNGEDVFLQLDENIARTEAVVAQIHDHLRNEGILIPPPVGGGGNMSSRERKPKIIDVREQIVAASALCQLSQPTPSPLDTSFSVPSDPTQIRNIVLGSTVSSSNVVKL